MAIQLSPYIKCGFRQNGDLSFGFGSVQKIITQKSEMINLLMLSSYLKEPRSSTDLNNFVQQHSLHASYDFLIQNPGYLIDTEFYNVDSRYSRTALFFNMNGLQPVHAQEKLQRSHVVILGCGGIGNQIACTLCTSGVGKLTLVDHDVIELSNLTRQFLFTEEDIGKKKAETLKRCLEQRNQETDIHSLDIQICEASDLNLLPSCDLLVLSADHPGEIINWCNDYCIRARTPYINVGYVLDIAIVGPFVIPGETGCIRCNDLFAVSRGTDTDFDHYVKSINTQNQAPSIGPINMVASGLAALDVIKFLTGMDTIATKNKRMGYWTHKNHIEYQSCTKKTECEVCGEM